MGLSSSQVRLLNLTTRMHQIEYKAAKIEAQKLQIANESAQVYNEYLNALDATKIQIKTLNSDGSASYKDISSYKDFLDAGYGIKPINTMGNSPYCQKTIDRNDCQFFLNISVGLGYNAKMSSDDACDYFDKIAGHIYGASPIENVEQFKFFELCVDLLGVTTEDEAASLNVSEVITNLINSGDVIIVRLDDESETSVATDTGLQEVSDETLLRKVEAKYEADMRRIDMKDRKYDTDLAALDTERNAIKQEMETLKTVAKDNVERTFKLFG